jgi:hypothetical protein
MRELRGKHNMWGLLKQPDKWKMAELLYYVPQTAQKIRIKINIFVHLLFA